MVILRKRSVLCPETAADALNDDEQRLLDAVDAKRVLYELVNTPPLPSSDNARILYAFFALGLIVPREPRQIKVQLKTDGGKYA